MSIFVWKPLQNGDWSDQNNWLQLAIPDDIAATATLGIGTIGLAAGESFVVQTVAGVAGTVLDISGTLSLALAGAFSFFPVGSLIDLGTATIEATGLLTGYGAFNLFSSVLNRGTIDSTTTSGALSVGSVLAGGVNNQGTLLAENGGQISVLQDTLANLSGNTLTGGTYIARATVTASVVGNGFQYSTNGATVTFNTDLGQSVVTDNATIVLDGFGSIMRSIDPSQAAQSPVTYTTIDQSLATIGAQGVLELLDGRNLVASNAITDAGLLVLQRSTVSAAGLSVTSGGTLFGSGSVLFSAIDQGTIEANGGFLIFANRPTGTGTLRVDAGATLQLPGGTYAQTVTDNGSIFIQSGDMVLTGGLTGTGNFIIQGGTNYGTGANDEQLLMDPTTTLELGSGQSAGVFFDGAGGLLQLDAPTTFTGAVSGFGAGDTIALGGLVANSVTLVGRTLNIVNNGATVDTITIAGNYGAGVQFAAVATNGTTDITLTGQAPLDYQFIGGVWPTKTITWAFATGSYAVDTSNNHAFSNAIDPNSAAAMVIESAFARWAAVGGFNFVMVPDSTDPTQAPDIRVGWADLLSSGGELGQANTELFDGLRQPDNLVRLEDPAELPLVANAGVIGGLVYQGYASTFYQVAAHEIGHDLGLDHSTDPTALMYPIASGVTNQDVSASDIAGINALYASVACYAAGTSILTDQGERRVETLAPGDFVVTPVAGGTRRVRWVGHRTLRPDEYPTPDDVHPVRVRAGAFGPGAPARDLLLSPEHAIFVEHGEGGALIPVRHLLNGRTIVRESVVSITYYHVELEEDGHSVHEVIVAEGLLAESYLDTGNRSVFANGGRNLAELPFNTSRAWAALAYAPLHVAGPAVTATRARLQRAMPRAA